MCAASAFVFSMILRAVLMLYYADRELQIAQQD
jgi:hypothetical protein